jgi:uncharacterized protein YndB with AHSA1/START domain
MARSKTLRKEVLYPFPPKDVWVALTDRHALAEWLMPNDFEPIVGRRFRFQIDPMPGSSAITECVVLECDPPKRLVYSWCPLPKQPGVPPPPPSKVAWSLQPEGEGTRLVLEHSGLEIFAWWERFMLRFGWGTMVKRWIPKIIARVKDGRFTPGAIPLEKRCYKAANIPSDLTK